MKRLYQYLKSKNINVYFPGQHKGLCNESYVVIHKTVQIPEIGTNLVGIQGVDIIVYSPINSYINAEEYEETIRKELKNVEYLRKTGFETAWIIDDKKEALTKSIEYVIQKEIEV